MSRNSRKARKRRSCSLPRRACKSRQACGSLHDTPPTNCCCKRRRRLEVEKREAAATTTSTTTTTTTTTTTYFHHELSSVALHESTSARRQHVTRGHSLGGTSSLFHGKTFYLALHNTTFVPFISSLALKKVSREVGVSTSPKLHAETLLLNC